MQFRYPVDYLPRIDSATDKGPIMAESLDGAILQELGAYYADPRVEEDRAQMKLHQQSAESVTQSVKGMGRAIQEIFTKHGYPIDQVGSVSMH
jgi:hypothetical protein